MTSETSELIYSTLGDDPDLADIVEMFVDEMPERVETLTKFFIAKDWEELGRMAHQLKGAAGSYGFDDLTPGSAALEESVRKGGTEADISTALDHLVDQCQRVRPGGAPY
jgi:HPt (histidine-containing phosphotransfer) domain-containing protein